MGGTWIHDAPNFPGPQDEHPVLAVVALIAVVAAMLLILWARIEVHGTGDLEATLAEPAAADAEPAAADAEPVSPARDSGGATARDVDDAVATGRWAAGFAH